MTLFAFQIVMGEFRNCHSKYVISRFKVIIARDI